MAFEKTGIEAKKEKQTIHLLSPSIGNITP